MDIGRQAISKNALENLIKTNRVEGPIGGQTTLQQGTIMQLCSSQPGSDVRQIREQNEHLRAMIASLNNTLNEPPQFEEKQAEAPQQIDMAPMIERNNLRIKELEELIVRQRTVIEEYQRGFAELQVNISNLRTLDADIYKRLSSHDGTFHNRVYQLRRALHSGAPYERLMRMIDEIK